MSYRFLILMLLVFPQVIYGQGLVPACGLANTEPCQACHIVQLVQNVLNWLVVALGIIAVLMIIYAGISLVTSAGNAAAMSKAKNLMSNMFIGYIIVLGGWLLVDTVMKTLLDNGGNMPWGPWNLIPCVSQPVLRMGEISPGSWASSSAPGRTGGTGGGVQCDPANTACSVAALQAAGFSAQQANVMSCIAMTESSGIPSWGPYNTRHPGSNSSACGTFQVTRTTWNSVTRSQGCQDFSQCTNATCNAEVARALVDKRPASNPYGDWTCPGCNSKAQACIDRYSTP